LAGRAGFGWQPVAVGLLAWTTGVWLARRGRAPVAQAPSAATTVETGV